ncbi:hypothetical protein FKM82_029856 [Ascaphus truei]
MILWPEPNRDISLHIFLRVLLSSISPPCVGRDAWTPSREDVLFRSLAASVIRETLHLTRFLMESRSAEPELRVTKTALGSKCMPKHPVFDFNTGVGNSSP